VTTGGEAGVVLKACAFFDNSSCFRVFCPGLQGFSLEVYDCVVRRGGRVWADEHRPRRVAGHRNQVHEEEMGEPYWERATFHSWERIANLPGGLSLLQNNAGVAA